MAGRIAATASVRAVGRLSRIRSHRAPVVLVCFVLNNFVENQGTSTRPKSFATLNPNKLHRHVNFMDQLIEPEYLQAHYIILLYLKQMPKLRICWVQEPKYRVGKYACFCLRVVATNNNFSAATCEQSLFRTDMRQNLRSC